MRILIARHGQTEWNLAGRIQGSGDSALTALGEQQADALGEAWQGEGIRTVYCSPLGRAVATAQRAAAPSAAVCVPEAGLVERAFGQFEGMPIQQLRADHADCDAIILGTSPALAAPEGETLLTVIERMQQALQQVIEASHEATIGVVTHGHCLLGLVWDLAGRPENIRQFHHVNASYSELAWDGQQLKLLRWAIAGHVIPLPA